MRLRSNDARALHARLLVNPTTDHTTTALHLNTILRSHLRSSNFSQAIHLFNHSTTLFINHADNYTFPLILKACSGLRSLEHGRNVHHLILLRCHNTNFIPNAYTKCALIDMFAKCGSLADARRVFDEMPHIERDLASWTSIICGEIHQRHEIEALSVFETMRRQGTRPDSALMAAVLPACGRLLARGTGMALQGCALKTGVHGDLFVSNAIIDMYCKFGDTFRAHAVFCQMLCKDDVSWRTLISGYSQNSQYQQSLELYSARSRPYSKPPSAVLVASVLPAIGKLNLPEHGKAMHAFILKQGWFDRDVVVGIALMDMYSSCSSAREMEVLLNAWPDDLVVWNSAIAGHENYDFALGVFRKMLWESDKPKPNHVTFVSVLPICTKMGALKQGMEIHCYTIKSTIMPVSVSNSLIDMYCKCGYLGLGLRVFDHCMMEKDVVSYNTIISAYGFYGYGKQALTLFDEMRSLGVNPTKATFVGLLSACSHAGLVDEGWSIYRSMIDDYGLRPNMEHYSCMVDLLGRAGRIDDACNFIRTVMPEEPDGNVLGCLIAACRVHCGAQLPIHLLEEILKDKLEDSGYHILLSNMYASTNKWKDASRVRALIKEKGLTKKRGTSRIQIGYCMHVFDARDTTHSEFGKIQQVLGLLVSEMKEEWDSPFMT
ncbi:pentatricopeptide repeat-containing protein at4g33990 [Phtheirospermum japonicum]|uniref:Pentatricopeptide repeat-containing protein at4g33990 n=1 Tax=Phtheirospermum japonicum TaxID=374723 RepID=A0A830BU85_9LAMI|nr:pentatricopeptide repeat-containing protein at4g33990 [Phtheirospermum japonicum]